MKAVKGKNTKNFAILNKSKAIDPPKGFHWMEEGGRYYLMEGDYKPHRLIVLEFVMDQHLMMTVEVVLVGQLVWKQTG